MMRGLTTTIISGCLVFAAMPLKADEATNDYYNQQSSTNTQNLVNYLRNLGSFFGYDITNQPGSNYLVGNELLSTSTIQLSQNYLFNTVLGAIPVNAASQALGQFVPSNTPAYSPINGLSNYTFSSQPYNSPTGAQQGKITVIPLMDQQSYQPDPVSQSVLNVLGTPDFSYCLNYDGTALNQNCQLLNNGQVSNNIIGSLPDTYKYFTYSYNQQFLTQLNGNTLIAPLLYSQDDSSANSTSSGSPNQQNQGLTATNQAQQAANFIRYATGAVTPVALPKLKEYDKLYAQAMNLSNNVSPIDQSQAQNTLSNYFTSLRSFAAQYSVGVSNLYYILSKRMPQNQSTDSNNNTSEALSEFTMATWRIYNPAQPENKQWLNQINQASPATVQKEMAALLAEINYQLYLSRQQQERLLLTNTILLLQNAKASQPSADFTTRPND